jgi:hypothetical protein
MIAKDESGKTVPNFLKRVPFELNLEKVGPEI